MSHRLTDYLDICGVALVTLFAFSIWPPLCLLVVGLACLTASWKAHQ